MERNEIIRVVREFSEYRDVRISPELLLESVSYILELPREEITGKSKKRELITARQLIILYAAIYTNWTTTKIGKVVNRGYSDVSHLLRTAFEQTLNGTAPELKSLFWKLKLRINDQKNWVK